MRDCMDSCRHGASTKNKVKNLFVRLDKFALELDVITKSNAALLKTVPPPDHTSRIPFTENEIKTLWEHVNVPNVDLVMIAIYTGFRCTELRNIELIQVDLNQNTITGGIKTASGKNRIVPIHPKILPLVIARYNSAEKYRENTIYKAWYSVMDRLNMRHTPHEARHTLRSRVDSAGANKRCMDLIMGHKSKDVGERTYTHKTIEELHTEMSKID